MNNNQSPKFFSLVFKKTHGGEIHIVSCLDLSSCPSPLSPLWLDVYSPSVFVTHLISSSLPVIPQQRTWPLGQSRTVLQSQGWACWGCLARVTVGSGDLATHCLLQTASLWEPAVSPAHVSTFFSALKYLCFSTIPLNSDALVEIFHHGWNFTLRMDSKVEQSASPHVWTRPLVEEEEENRTKICRCPPTSRNGALHMAFPQNSTLSWLLFPFSSLHTLFC